MNNPKVFLTNYVISFCFDTLRISNFFELGVKTYVAIVKDQIVIRFSFELRRRLLSFHFTRKVNVSIHLCILILRERFDRLLTSPADSTNAVNSHFTFLCNVLAIVSQKHALHICKLLTLWEV